MIGFFPVYSRTAPPTVKDRADAMGLTEPFRIKITNMLDWKINPFMMGHSRISHITSTLLPKGEVMLIAKSDDDGMLTGFTTPTTKYFMDQLYERTVKYYRNNGVDVTAWIIPQNEFREKFKVHKTSIRN